MIIKTNRIFKKKGICQSLDELRKVSGNYDIFLANEISLNIYPSKDFSAIVKPFNDTSGLDPIKSWRGKLDIIELSLPLTDKTNKKLNKIYGEDKFDSLGLRWKSIDASNLSWDYYRLSLYGKSPCYKNGESLNMAINHPNNKSTDLCFNCKTNLNRYCNDLVGTLNKFSLPKEISIHDYREKKS